MQFQFNIDVPDFPNPQGTEADGRFFPMTLGLEFLTRINQWHFRCGRAVPLEESGAVYREEPPGPENWDDCITVARRKWGDCDDLAPYLCAQIRELYKVHAECVITYKFITSEDMLAKGYPAQFVPDDGCYLVHVLVRMPDGRELDPSKWLGMKGDY